MADGSELTTLKAVEELFRRKREAKKEGDRARKAPSTKKSQKNVVEFQGQKAERIPPKSGTKSLKAEATKQKAEAPEGA